jgi:vancomycin permeability regulator SanA
MFKKVWHYFISKALLSFLTIYLVSGVYILYDGLNDVLFQADLIIVPGNKVELDGTPSPRLKARLDKAADLFKQHQAKLIFVSGGIGKEGFDESVVMSDYLSQQHIPHAAIILDNQGIDTLSTARNASVFMKNQQLSSAIVVSQYFHISRTKFALRKMGISKIGNAYAHYVEFRDGYSLMREVLAYASYLAVLINA